VAIDVRFVAGSIGQRNTCIKSFCWLGQGQCGIFARSPGVARGAASIVLWLTDQLPKVIDPPDETVE
jgi:hypothetical protein